MAAPRPSQAAFTSSNPSSSSSSSAPSSQHPQVSLLGTIPSVHLSPLLSHITHRLTSLPPLSLFERETILSRHDDTSSSIREKHDNAWAAVVRSRRGVRLRVSERFNEQRADEVDCHLVLPLPSLPERQYPSVTVRPSVTVQLLGGAPHLAPGATTTRPNSVFSTPSLPHPPSSLDTDTTTGWRTLVSSLGWTPSLSFIRHGLEFVLDDQSSSSSSRRPRLSTPLHPITSTLHILRIYRIFQPDPTGFLPHKNDNDYDYDNDDEEWTPLDPDGHTIVVELLSTVGAKLDESHFTHASILASTPNGYARSTAAERAVTADKDDSLENAIAHAEAVAKSLRGFVDLKREKVDF